MTRRIPLLPWFLRGFFLPVSLCSGPRSSISWQPSSLGSMWPLQLVSAALYSLGHGTNDAQKTMGIIAALLFAQGLLGSTFYVPFYVILLAGTAMGFGTYFGGWRIVRTMGMKITKLHPFGGFSAETAAASTLFATASLGIPVSTTHTIAGAIMGVGSTRRLSAVRWGVARRIVYAWVLTIPAAAAIAGLSYYVLSLAGLS